MRCHFRLLISAASLLILALPAMPARGSSVGGSRPPCADAITATTTSTGATTATSSPSETGACWTDVKPYPFGSEGEAVDGSSPKCDASNPEGYKCYLQVTSMAFRAWNRGLAATESTALNGVERATTQFGVWTFNGAHWSPDPTFPGQSACPGNTIVWAGKLDYWLVGGPFVGVPPQEPPSHLCRFDGATLEWEPFTIPAATQQHVLALKGSLRAAAITAAACFSYDDCWFFGNYGTVMHWDGAQVSDASPDPSQPSLQGEYTDAVARQDAARNSFGAAVGATSSERAAAAPLRTRPSEGAPPQFYGSSGEAFSPLSLALPTTPQLEDPYRTDLVAVDVDSARQGWTAGNPAGWRVQFESAPESRQFSSPSPQASPLLPVSLSGAASGCTGPPASRFTFTPFTADTAPTGAFLWSSIAEIPGADEALAGGRVRPKSPGAAPNEDASNEPVIARTGCDGASGVARFRVADPTNAGQVAPADRNGYVSAIVANASNDAWAATSTGTLLSRFIEPPHLYRLTDGQPPAAPEGDDVEFRPLPSKEDEPIIELEPPAPEAPPEPPATVSKTRTVTLPPAVYDVRVKLHKTKRHGQLSLSLYLSFRLRRPATIGARALRHGHVVSIARARHFTGRTGLLVLKLDRRRWPTRVGFIA